MSNPASEFDVDSGIFSVPQGLHPEDAQLRSIEDSFIEAWARMAGAFAMDATMGRVHALIYLSPDAVDQAGISARLGLPEEVVALHVETLTDWGLVYDARDGFVAEQDPWTWFVRTIRARQGRELLPIRNAIEAVRDSARQLAKTSSSPAAARLRTIVGRIDRFASFVGDFAKLVDAFVTLGAAPMLKFVSMTTRFVPRRAA